MLPIGPYWASTQFLRAVSSQISFAASRMEFGFFDDFLYWDVMAETYCAHELPPAEAMGFLYPRRGNWVPESLFTEEFKKSMIHHGLPGAFPLRLEQNPMHKNIEMKRMEERSLQSLLRLSELLKAETPSHAQIPITKIQMRTDPFSASLARSAFHEFMKRPKSESHEKEVENFRICAQLFQRNPLAEKRASGT